MESMNTPPWSDSLLQRYLATIWRKSGPKTIHNASQQVLEPYQRAISEPSSLNGHGIFAIIVFACVTLIVIYPIRIPIPYAISQWLRSKLIQEEASQHPHPLQPAADPAPDREPSTVTQRSSSEAPPQRYYFTLNHVSAPITGILFLLATKTIGGEEIKLGIVGDEGVEPYDVLALFISLAYIAISVDATGLLRYLAFHVSLRGGKSGPRLFYLLYLFFFLLGLGVGNDPVILSGTAFLVYFTRIAGITRPDAWIWAQFAAANISSATLVSSNPTNLVIASGGKITFPVYSAFMALPTVVSGAMALLVIRLGFANWTTITAKTGTTPAEGNHDDDDDDDDGDRGPRQTVFIPKHLIPPDVDPRTALVDPIGAVFGTVVMGATLATLIGTSVSGHVKVYQIALPGAALCLLRDAFRDLREWYQRKAATSRQRQSKNQMEMTARPASASQAPNASPATSPKSELATSDTAIASNPEPASSVLIMPAVSGVAQSSASQPSATSRLSPTQKAFAWLVKLQRRTVKTLPTISLVMSRLPFPLLPFAFGMFILVQSLAHVGFVRIMAGGLGKVCGSGGEIGTTFFIGFLSVVLCSLGGTNIGACILLVRAFQEESFTSHLPAMSSAKISQTALYSLALGSNIGALGGTFAASLAGLLWRASLKQGGIHVYQRQFLLWSIFTTPLCLAAGLVVVWAQVRSGKWPQ